MEIRLAKAADIDNWMLLVDKLKGSFPGLETEEELKEHKNTVLKFMEDFLAICAEVDNQLAGILLFSKDDSMLCFLAVDSNYRRCHIGTKMVSYMLTFMDDKKDVSVTTYRENVPKGVSARAFYQHLGFKPGRLTEEFGSPVQEFVLKGGRY